MTDITIKLTPSQLKGLEYATVSPQEWVTNAALVRAQIANDEITDITVKHCLDNDIQVPATRELIIAYAFDNGLVQTLADVVAADEANTL